MNILFLTGSAAAILAVSFLFLIRGLFARVSARAQTDESADWFRDFSLEAYRPMERLMDENDYRFLEKQPGYRPSIAGDLRSERKRIFRIYLHDLVGDFNRMLRVAKLMVVYSSQDRPDFARAIANARNQFYWNVLKTELTLSLPWGVVEAGRLIQSVGRIQESVRELAAGQGLA